MKSLGLSPNALFPVRARLLLSTVISGLIGISASHGAVVLTTFDDGVVQGSLGVGDDISSSETFGFDTLRLKQNNIRIHFEDTSSSGGFASNDWRITINDNSSGGANFFSIDDVTANRVPFLIEAGAPTNSLYVDSTGRLGVGRADPVVEVHVVDGDTAALRLEQDGSNGFTQHTWDMAGNETNFFIRDVTNSSALPFRIFPGSGNDDTLCIRANGDVGIGSDSTPQHNLHVFISDSATEGMIIAPSGTTPTATFHVEGTGYFSQTLEVGSTRTSKEKIRELTLEEAMDTLHGLEPVQFHYLQDPNAQLGFIAEDVPDLVATERRNSIRPMDFVAVLTKVVKEQDRREKELSETVKEQEKRIEALMQRLDAVEANFPKEKDPLPNR